MGGSSAADTNRASNIVRLCSGDHVWVERHRTEALELGLLVRQGADPAAVPVVLTYGRVFLDDAGGWRAA